MKNIYLLSITIILFSCSTPSAYDGSKTAPSLPVIAVQAQDATIYQDYNASIEGTTNIELRPQVDGYLSAILADEGAYVRKGQVLFQIDNKPFVEQLNNAKASLLSAQANLESARINVDKLAPLVQNNLVSDVQVRTAKAAYDAARANVAQAEAIVNNAHISLGYTRIVAPVNGYLGRIPYKTGSLVGHSSPEPLTVLSEIQNVYAYFSLSENDMMQFKERFTGRTIEEKLANLPPVQLVLTDNSIYPEKGKVELAEGQFDKTTGTISFRAVFPNTSGLLRSGNTGRIRLPQLVSASVVIPQEATYEVQDKIFVFQLADSNKVVSHPITVTAHTGKYYLVSNGVKPGDKIVYAGLDHLKDGDVISPQQMSIDSLLRIEPL